MGSLTTLFPPSSLLDSDGRTETVRPVTHESVRFVQAMQDPEATDADRIQALKA